MILIERADGSLVELAADRERFAMAIVAEGVRLVSSLSIPRTPTGASCGVRATSRGCSRFGGCVHGESRACVVREDGGTLLTHAGGGLDSMPLMVTLTSADTWALEVV